MAGFGHALLQEPVRQRTEAPPGRLRAHPRPDRPPHPVRHARAAAAYDRAQERDHPHQRAGLRQGRQPADGGGLQRWPPQAARLAAQPRGRPGGRGPGRRTPLARHRHRPAPRRPRLRPPLRHLQQGQPGAVRGVPEEDRPPPPRGSPHPHRLSECDPRRRTGGRTTGWSRSERQRASRNPYAEPGSGPPKPSQLFAESPVEQGETRPGLSVLGASIASMTSHPNTPPGTPGADGVPGALARIRHEIADLTQTLWAARGGNELMDTIAEAESLKSTVDALVLDVVRELEATNAVKPVG